MTLYTSRYFNGGLAERSDLLKVGITVGKPRRLPAGVVVDDYLSILAPAGKLFHLNTPHEFIPAYRNYLDGKGVTRVRTALETLRRRHRADAMVLLCFEDCRIIDGRLKEWCHRLVFAEWWKQWTGEVVPEFEHEGLPTWQFVDLNGAIHFAPPVVVGEQDE